MKNASSTATAPSRLALSTLFARLTEMRCRRAAVDFSRVVHEPDGRTYEVSFHAVPTDLTKYAYEVTIIRQQIEGGRRIGASTKAIQTWPRESLEAHQGIIWG